MWAGVGVVAGILALAGGGYYVSQRAPKSAVVSSNSNSAITTATSSAKKDVLTGKMIDTPTALSAVPNFDALTKAWGVTLSQAQKDYLDKNSFLLVPGTQSNLDHWGFDEFLSMFDHLSGSSDIHYRAPENAKYVSSDLALHAYHKFFEMTLEELEQHELYDGLDRFLSGLFENINTARGAASAELKPRYDLLGAQVATARALLANHGPKAPAEFSGPQDETEYAAKDEKSDPESVAQTFLKRYLAGYPAALVQKASTELTSMYKASDGGVSPLYGGYKDDLKTDYTQYTPRSHYAKNSQLRAYFRAMMFLGRNSYFFQKQDGISDALLLSDLIGKKSASGVMPADEWKKNADVITFYVGQSDDVTYTEWMPFLKKAGVSFPVAENLSGAVSAVNKNFSELPLPRILSDITVNPDNTQKTKEQLLRETVGFRLFGQRFTYDAWILNSLTSGDEKAIPKRPSMPSALFVPAVLGDTVALHHVKEFLKADAGFSESEINGFGTALKDIQDKISKVTRDEWYRSMGSAWVYVLGSLTKQYGEGYPLYMQSLAFADKQIQSFLGSYTELKHDTLLYAKQSYAELGGGGAEPPPIPPVVKGLVEPNVEFWHRLNDLIGKTDELFTTYGLFRDHVARSRLGEFKKDVQLFTSIAEKEIQGTTISDDDYETLRTLKLSYIAEPFRAGATFDDDTRKTALVADIHTDGKSQRILYEGNADPLIMLVKIANEKSPRITIGPVYNHYEFTGPLGGKRTTDEDWKDTVYNKPENLPKKNVWYQSLEVVK
ncbi:MAG: DUF3160 domain-containing protein [bacterium]|nr:DUF3160 domain-containing protein [bacterium]